ncbi:hypothetical protein ACWGJB_41355 [Streptomyces sp. NPDC054813]
MIGAQAEGFNTNTTGFAVIGTCTSEDAPIVAKTSIAHLAAWKQTWASAAKHTIKIVVSATSGRPAVTTDGIAYLRQDRADRAAHALSRQ